MKDGQATPRSRRYFHIKLIYYLNNDKPDRTQNISSRQASQLWLAPLYCGTFALSRENPIFHQSDDFFQSASALLNDAMIKIDLRLGNSAS